MSQPKKRHIILRAFLKLTSSIISVIALPMVRNFVWDKATGKAKAKIIDAEAKIVESEEKDEPKKKLFG